METAQFKTNIKCSGCIEKVTPVLNQIVGQDNWEVDLQSPEKVLTVSSNNINRQAIKEGIEKAGYNAEQLA